MRDKSLPDHAIGSEAFRPNPALEHLAFLIGTWRTESTHPLAPGKTLRGRASFNWHCGGAFVLMCTEIDEPRFPSGVALIGSDDSGGSAQLYFDERGVSRVYQVTGGEGYISWRRDDPRISQTVTITQEGADTLKSLGRISQEGGPWGDDLIQKFYRSG